MEATNMHRLIERDYDVIELLQEAPQGIHFNELVARLSVAPSQLMIVVNKLKGKNIISMDSSETPGLCQITESNERIIIRKVKCPRCFCVKRIYGAEQKMTSCVNPECKTPLGYHRVFWVFARRRKNPEVVQSINLAN